MDAILRILDAVLGARLNLDRMLSELTGARDDHADVAVCFMAHRFPQAEDALRVWARANNLEVREHERDFDFEYRLHTIRTVDVFYKRERIAWVQWPPIMKEA